jgi:sulfatase maturation enzyme AslB (radical SAM superfamily)
MDEKIKVQWLWGNYCNYNCRYCPDHLHNNQFRLPPADQFVDAMSYLARVIRMEGKTPCFDFTGGEPTKMPFLVAGLKESSGNFGRNNRLTTNGSADLDWWKENYWFFDEIEISYHVGWANIDHIVEVYNFLITVEDAPYVEVVVHAVNKDTEWLRAVGVYETLKEKNINTRLKMLYSSYTTGNQYLPYKTYQWEYYYATIGKVFNAEKTAYVQEDIMPQRYRHTINALDQIPKKEIMTKQLMCKAGIEQLVVWHNGNVFRGWCKAGGKLGNVFEKNVELPAEDIVCPFDRCKNGFDRQATKYSSGV